MTDGFDHEAFLAWLDDRDGPVPGAVLDDEWPDFPRDGLVGVTGPIVDGEFAYFRHDLERAARGRRPID